MQTLEALGHVSKDGSKSQPLESHLSEVERLAGNFARSFGSEAWGRICGRCHDVGKFSAEFQHRIRSVSGYEAHLVDGAPGKVDHSTAGALLANRLPGPLGRPLAYIIAGHHAGLPDWSPSDTGPRALDNRLKEGAANRLLEKALDNAPPEYGEIPPPDLQRKILGPKFDGVHLWVRMLFSCLTDADFLDTEAFMSPEAASLRGNYPEIASLRDMFNRWMAEKLKSAETSGLNQIRADVLRQCRAKATGATGLYTLTVPTGGGKTLSSLAFALEHANTNRKRRIVYAIPYTSIIEQTADVFRDIFDDAVVEHHSNLDVDRETPESRLAAENWNAPLIITTNVQLFESLFAARNSRCRKLHNLVNSVVILDEAQLLPPEFLQPVLDVMRLLIEHYGVTFVLCTATQPALGTQRAGHNQTLLRGLDDATEIVEATEALYRRLERVRVHLPDDFADSQSWDAIAEKLKRHPSVLAIVNSRGDCRELHRRMPTDTVHLSALMCGEHRSVLIAEIKDRLSRKEPVRVVSTQLIEAGVDVDFPVVYRALAGLDSIAQAAGRCNREGTLGDKGEVHVFIPSSQAPRGLLRFGEDAARLILQERPDNPLVPELFQRYFQQYYSRAGQNGGMDKHGLGDLLTKDAKHCHIQFRTAAEKFRMIDDSASVSVLVPYANPHDPRRDSRPLLARLRAGEMHRDLMRQLQRYTVNIREDNLRRLERCRDVEPAIPGLWVLCNETRYSNKVGLLLGETDNPDPEDLFL